MHGIHLAVFSLFLTHVIGARLPLKRRSISSGVPMKASQTGATTLSDNSDLCYSIDIEVGGHTFSVEIDTGSTDLWLITEGSAVQYTNRTNLTAEEQYGVGSASGPIDFAQLQIGPYKVPSQAFINARNDSGTAPTVSNGLSGLLGLSFANNVESPITKAVKDAYGEDSLLGLPPISNIFAQNPGHPNCFDIALGREAVSDGAFLIGEHAIEHSDIISQPKLYKQVEGRWTLPLDAMTINGTPFKFGPSSIPGIQPGKLGAVLDTGYSLPPIPPAAVDAIYGQVPGAVNLSSVVPYLGPTVASSGSTWSIPCESQLNLSFTFGGIDYPIHPLDITRLSIVSLPVGPRGTVSDFVICINTFVANTFDPKELPGIDLILGQPFLRNVYASFNMGDADGSGNGSFVQLLSTVDTESVDIEFDFDRAINLAFFPPTIDSDVLQKLIDSGVLQRQNVSSTGAETSATGALAENDENTPNDGQLTSLVKKWGPVAIGLLGANVGVGLILCVIGLLAFIRGRSGVKGKSINPSYTPVRFKETISVAEEEE